MYKLWDEFIIEASQMFGYWHSKYPITTDNKNVLTTVYKKGESALLCVYNFSNKKEHFNFLTNRELLGFEPCDIRKIKLGSNIKKHADITKSKQLGGHKGAIYWLKA